MIVIKVDPDKLPKASDLKAQLFPATLSVHVSDQDLRFITRTAFPDLSVLVGTIPAFGMMPMPVIPGATPGASNAGAAGGDPSAAQAGPGARTRAREAGPVARGAGPVVQEAAAEAREAGPGGRGAAPTGERVTLTFFSSTRG